MAGVLNLRNVLELVIDGFDDGALAQKELIFQVHEAVLHIFAEFGDQLQVLVIEQFHKNRFGDVAPVAKQTLGELGQRHSVIHIACGQIIRALWQTQIGVESTKLMPLQRPNCVFK